MNKPHKKAVFIFRRDLRLEDNLGLLTALEASDEVIPLFIFDPEQIDRSKNKYFSEPAFHFMLQSLSELHEALAARGSQLYVCYGNQADVVASLITKDGVDAVYMNKDYTPFARKRDKAIAVAAEKKFFFFLLPRRPHSLPDRVYSHRARHALYGIHSVYEKCHTKRGANATQE